MCWGTCGMVLPLSNEYNQCLGTLPRILPESDMEMFQLRLPSCLLFYSDRHVNSVMRLTC